MTTAFGELRMVARSDHLSTELRSYKLQLATYNLQLSLEIYFLTAPLYTAMPKVVESPDLKDTSNINFLMGDAISNVYVTVKIRPVQVFF